MTVTTKLQADAGPGELTVDPPRPKAFDPVAHALDASGLPPAQAGQVAGLWQSVRTRHHDPEQAARDLFPILRQHRLPQAAAKIAASFAEAYPDRAWPLVELARLASRTGDHAGSLAAAQRLMTAFPDDAAGPLHAVTALLALRQTRPAQDILAALPATAARLAWVHAARVQVAIQHHDHAGVLEQAALLRAAAPFNPFGYLAACTSLRTLGRGAEAEALVQQALTACPNRMDVHQEAALVAEAAGRYDLALARWAEVRALSPGSPQGYLGAIKCSRRCAQPGLTEQLLADAVAAFPRNRLLLLAAARMAAGRQRWGEADEHWTSLAELVPNDPSLQVEAATSLIGPPPGRKRRLPEVLRRLDAVHDRFPDYCPAYTAHLAALREARSFDEAEACGRAWGGRFPADQALAMMRARLAQDVGRTGDAVAVIESVRALTPASAELEAAYVRALSLAGRDEAAERAVAEACAKVGDDARLLAEHVRLATRRGDLDEAVRRADAACQKRPADESMRRLAARTRSLAGEAETSRAEEAAPEAAGSGTSLASFFERFESLGATRNGCEFGLVQRAFGAGPLGLMRWAAIPADRLIAGLQTGFEGIAAPEHLKVDTRRASADHEEYALRSELYGYWTHTFVKVEDLPHDRMLQQSLRRMRFLQAKLVEDLQAGEKMFVFKFSPRPDAATVLHLFEALCTYGQRTLLCATLADADHPAGTLEMLRPGLFLGRFSKFTEEAMAGEAGIDTEQWRLFCERVAAWHDARPDWVGALPPDPGEGDAPATPAAAATGVFLPASDAV